MFLEREERKAGREGGRKRKTKKRRKERRKGALKGGNTVRTRTSSSSAKCSNFAKWKVSGPKCCQKLPGGLVTGPGFQQNTAFHHSGNALLLFQAVSTKMIVCLLTNNPSSVLGSKRSRVSWLPFSQSCRRVFDVCLQRSLPVCSLRHWKRRRHLHSCTFLRPFTLEDKLPGMDFTLFTRS